MIDANKYAISMGALGDRFGRKLQPPTLAMYYKALGHLTTEQFEAAAQGVFESQRFNAWPAPQAFLDQITPPSALPTGHAAFERVYTLTATTAAYGRHWDDIAADIACELGPGAARAASGMRARFAAHDVADVPFLRRDFLAEYEQATAYEAQAERVEALLPGTIARLLADPRAQLLPTPPGPPDPPRLTLHRVGRE